ncbi:DnaJ domain-containing protein [Vibrio sp. ZSDZ65]|uniref:DnaJ domain-containing protein n=1 Tax=Vibrio qingdaonensis TaxID=2829491 RepID=A0A9X3HW52_9VIBR|nr:DnaJ domain-containing protein [Vibrio qingdaonensis]MCW8346026.1 DnaJ domain-containing protein [Vibrio qingdaonensis]
MTSLYIVVFALILAVIQLFFLLRKYRKKVQELQTTYVESSTNAKEADLQVNTVKTSTDDMAYFKSENDRILFLLLEVDGKRRNQLLGITSEMYEDEEAAKKWYKSLSNKVHPDKNDDPRAAEAFDKLKQLYNKVTF